MRRALALAATLLPLAVLAEPVTIRSGEHDRFSRLVLSIPEGADWRLGRDGTGYVLDLGRADLEFDLGGIFERLPENRIADLSVLNGRLRLEPGCRCHSRAFLWQSDRLVIDLIDGPPPEDSEFEAELTSEVPVRVSAETGSSQLPTVFPPPARDPGLGALPDPIEDRSQTQPQGPDLAEFERSIVESLGRAASQGLLSPALDRPDPSAAPGTDARPPPEPETEGRHAGEAPPEPDIPHTPGLTARTTKDLSRPQVPEPVTAAGLTCIDAADVDVATWGDGRPFHDQIAPIRASLSSERDRILPEEALRLARLYVHFGFGREALEALRLSQGRSHAHDVLHALSHIVDGQPAPTRIFAGQIDCPTDVALWALLAEPELESGAGVSAPRILQSLRRLPPALRGHLGTEVAARFAGIGEDGTAETALAIARQGYTVDQTGTGLVAADVEARRGEIDAALETLGDLAGADPRMPPERLVGLIDLMIEEGRPVPPDLLTLAAAHRFESKDSPVAEALLSAEIRALVAAGRYEDGLALIDAEGRDLPAELRSDHATQAIIALSDNAEEGRFLSVVFSGSLPVELSDRAENALARRLLALGFAEVARARLAGPARHEAARERRYLRAEIAIALAEPGAGLRALRGMTDDRALALVARAHALEGDHLAALGAAGARPDRPIAPETAWRAGAWLRLHNSSDPLLRTVAERRDAPARPGPAPETLAESQALLDEADRTRALVKELLTRFAVESTTTTLTEAAAPN